MAIVGNIVEGIININYKAIREVLKEVYFEVTAKRNAIFNIGIVGVPTKSLSSLQELIDVEPYLYIDFVKA